VNKAAVEKRRNHLMHWIEEPNKTFPERPYHVLATEQGEQLKPAWVEYWKRILTDGYGLAPASRFALAIDVYARTFEADSMGQASATFRNSLNREAEGIGSYMLRSDHFTFLQGKDEDDNVFGRRQLVWFLENYKALKAALRDGEIWPLYERINSSHTLPIRLATINGWFDLQAGQEGFGTLPYEDQELLAGMEPTKEDPMEALTSGVLTSPRTTAVEELTAALIQFTPPHFKTIHCTIKEGVEEGQRALFYQIECPEFPDQGTTAVNDRVHRAGTLLVQQLAPEQGTFAGARIKLNMQADGLWQRSVELNGQ
jgi:hypothetical protein